MVYPIKKHAIVIMFLTTLSNTGSSPEKDIQPCNEFKLTSLKPFSAAPVI